MPPGNKVLVVAPAGGIRGGIDSVVSAHTISPMWRENHCELIKTYANGNSLSKVFAALKGYVTALFKIPSARLIHVHLAAEISLLRKLPFIAMAKLYRKPVILHLHAASPESLFDDTPSWAVRVAMLSPDRVVALSPAWAKSIQDRFPTAKVTVVSNPAMAPARPVDVDSREPVVLFVGKLEERKGYSDLIHAAKKVLAVVPEARFKLAGNGEVRKARQLAKALSISHAVECLGWIGKDQLSDLLNEGAVFCLPTYNEGVPMAMLEAMSHGLPVLTTPVGGIPDLIESYTNGILFTPGDVQSLAYEITNLLQNKEGLRSSLGQAGRTTVMRLCGLEQVGRQLSDIYEQVAPQSP